MPIHAIARELNHRGVPYQSGSRWTHHTVADVLTQPKYAGFHVYGRTTSRLYTPSVRLPKSDWLVLPRAFEPIVEYATFVEAQRILHSRTINKSDEELLEALRRLLAQKGRLSLRLVKESPDVPSPSTYRLRFGSLRKAYELTGYGHPEQFGSIDLRRRTQALRDELIARIAALFPNDVSIVRPGGRWRTRLRMRNGGLVSVLVARCVPTKNRILRWLVDPHITEHRLTTLLARLELGNSSFADFHIFRNLQRSTRFVTYLNDSWLSHGERLLDLKEFCKAVERIH
jgi:hypothetical protein